MDPQDGSYPGVFTGLVLATIAGAYALYGIAKVKGAIARASQPTAPPWGQQYAPWPGPPQPGPTYPPPPQYPPPPYPPPAPQQRSRTY